jgi:hypothetical protein
MILALLLAAATPQTAVEAERAFAAEAQTKGQWTAFRKYAAPDAIMMAPGTVNAHKFLERFASDPKVPVMWWPARVWVSCDDSLAVTTGPWVRRGGTQVGSFTTVWRREADGAWRWVYDNGRELPAAVDAPDEPAEEAVYCGGQPRGLDLSLRDPLPLVQFEGRALNEGREALATIRWGEAVASGQSRDRSLRWEVVRVEGGGADAYALRIFARTRNHERTALIEFHGFKPPAL